MKKRNQFLVMFFIGGLGGAFFYFILNLLFLGGIFDYSHNSDGDVIQKVERVVIKEPEFWSAIVQKREKAVLLIRSFKGGILLSQTNAVMLTHDGLVAAPRHLIPRNADRHQIFLGGEIVRGKVVFDDPQSNIALLRTNSTSIPAIEFSDENSYKVGTNILLLGKTIQVNTLNTFARRGMISRIEDVSYVDTLAAASPSINGAAVLDQQGKLFGIVQKNRANELFIIDSRVLARVLDEYIRSKDLLHDTFRNEIGFNIHARR